MTYGIQILRDNGSVNLDSGTVGGVFIEVVTMGASTSGAKTYTRVIGGTLYAYTLEAGNHVVTFSTNGLGQAVMSWSPSTGSNASQSKFAVFAKKLTATDVYGLNIVNDIEEVLVDTQYPVPQYLGSAASTNSTVGLLLPSGYVRYTFTVDASLLNAMGGTTYDRIVMMAMPSNGAADVWYAQATTFIAAGNTTTSAVIYILALQNASFVAPGVYVYALNKTPAASVGMGLQVYNAGDVIFSASAESLSVQQYLDITAPANNATAAYSVTFPAYAAAALPIYSNATPAGDGTDYYRMFYRRSGTQLEVKTVTIDHLGGFISLSHEYGNKSGSYGAVMDVSGIGYQATNFTPSSPPFSAPVITQQPASTGQMVEGQTMTLYCVATGNTSPTYQWLRNGGPVTGATSSTSYSRVLGAGDSTGDRYSCYVSNGAGYVTSVEAVLTVSRPTADQPTAGPPVITTQPTGRSATQDPQGSVLFSIVASPAQSYKWYRSGSEVVGATGPDYYSPTATVGDFPIYCVVSANGQVTQSNTVNLHVGSAQSPAPVISTQPVNTSTTLNTAAALTCVASPVTSYLWYLNEVSTGQVGTTYYPPTDVVGSVSVYCVCTNTGTNTNSAYATFTVTSGGGTYTSYNNMPDYYDEQYDATVEMYVSGDDTWHNGSGDYTLYDVMVSISSSSPATPFSGGANQSDTWYSFASSPLQRWVLKQPTTFRSGLSTHVQGRITIRLRSNGQEVSASNYLLSSVNS